ncbi:MAG: FAD-dependent oxidoreductase, partial [Candidatus Auribacterota bacterium]|nr:FAD-dependent oxidoreductase [Candidatus Auribacterota bacterium]
LDFCWICGHMPQRLFKALGCLQDVYNGEILQVSGEAGNFKVKFRKKDQIVNNFACIECDKCIEVCPVEVGDRKAIWVHPEAGWENIYLVDFEHCTKCGECEKICPTGALKIEKPEEIQKVDVGAIILAPEFDSPSEDHLGDFALGKSPSIVTNAEIAKRSLLTNFVKDSVKLPSGKIPREFGIVVTPHFNKPGIEYENYNLSVSSVYRGVRIKELIPEAEVTIFLRDYRGFGKGHYRWYQKAIDVGVRIERVDTLEIVPENGDRVNIHYVKEHKEYKQLVECAILITGQRPPQLMENFSEICGVKPDKKGFCNIRPYSPVETDVDGIFAVGEFSGPKGNPETIWDGCAVLTESLKYLGEPNFKPAPPPALEDVSGQERRIGVFICSCFNTFNDRMDLNSLKEKIEQLQKVYHAEIIEGCCTLPSIKETSEKIKKSGVNRVVLAVCTPLQKLLKYRKTVMMAGLNPLLSEYVRLREDVINVHQDRDKMLEKAFVLIRSAVERVKRGTQAPVLSDAFTPRAMVIGGGLSGLLCALDVADNGFPVVVIERRDELGGRVEYLEKEHKDFLQDLISKVDNSDNITVLKRAELRDINGYAGNFHATVHIKDEDIKVDAGVIFLATGAKEYKPNGFLFGNDAGVITQAQLLSKMDSEKPPSTVLMIQCIGSRNNSLPYCSRVCCNSALKNAVSLREKGSEVTILYRDINHYGREDYYRKAVDSGVKFIRFVKDNYPEVKRNGESLEVVLGNGRKEKTDLVVLSTGIMPDEENNRILSSLLGYPLDYEGFFESDASMYPYEEAIKKLTKPFELATNGIFPVGLAHSPKSFEDILLNAKDMVGRALVLLGKGKIPAPNAMYIAEVNESLCMGCGICIDACPYSARHIDEKKKIAVVHPFLCDSCGSCVAICPNNSSSLRDFKGEQVILALDSLLG